MSRYLHRSAVTLATLVGSTLASPASSPTLLNRASYNGDGSADTLRWGDCGVDIPPPFQCAILPVPLDWADDQKGQINLAIIKLPASTQPSEGYMFYNPGGPGASGIGFLAHTGPLLQAQIGNTWDVLSWDPRGVGASEPNTALFTTTEELESFWSQVDGSGHMNAHGNLTTQPDIDYFISKAPEYDSLSQSLNDKYIEKFGDTLKYIGSAANVRDLVAITEAIYGQGVDINFYGYSYGSLLGVYLTQMFPDRVGKVIIDGVLDADTWSNSVPIKAYATDFETAEQTCAVWAETCIAAGDKCRTATIAGNKTSSADVVLADIVTVIDKILATAYKNYDGTLWTTDDIPTSATAWSFYDTVTVIYNLLFSSDEWTTLDKFMNYWHVLQSSGNSAVPLTGDSNSTALLKGLVDELRLPKRKIGRTTGFLPPGLLDGGFTSAVSCGDAIDFNHVTTDDVFKTIVKVSQTVSPHFATIQNPRWACHKWTTRAVERLPLPMTTKPKNVILVIGNTADPITPYSSAKKIASGAHLGDKARLVRFNAAGHTSGSNNSTCIDDVISKFVRGTIPGDAGSGDPDVECNPDGNPFLNS